MDAKTAQQYGMATLGILKADLNGDDTEWKKHALSLMAIYGERLSELEAQAHQGRSDVQLREI